MNQQYHAPALEQGLQILERFGQRTERMRLSEIAREIGISRSSAFRLVFTLQSLGYLERDDETKSYRLGARVLSLGYSFLASKDVVEIARPILERLRDETNNSAHIGILDGSEVVYIGRVSLLQPVATNITVGSRLPAYATTMGRVLLAHQPEVDVKRLYGRAKLKRFSPRTPANYEELATLLASDRARNYAISHSNFEAGIASVAAPVFSATGAVVAAINVSGPEGTVTRQIFDSAIRDAVCGAARAVSDLLGYRHGERSGGFELEGAVAVVTGGTSGIGFAAAELLLEEGASVVICGRDAERARAAADRLRGRFRERIFEVAADVRDPGSMRAFRSSVVERFGKVDVLVHCAGASLMANFAATDDAQWHNELELKFFGFINPTRAFLDDLRASQRASIVYVAALLAIQPETRLTATSAARAGVLNLAKSLSFELAPDGIRVNSLLLGVIDSGQWERRWLAEHERDRTITREAFMQQVARDRDIPLGRAGTPQEVARAVAFLASPASAYTTGATLELSGGVGRRV